MKHSWVYASLLLGVLLLLNSCPQVVLADTLPPPQGGDVQNELLSALAARLIRCMDIDGEQYCLAIGFTDLKPGSPEWNSWLSTALAQPDSFTGDMSLATYLRLRAQLSPENLAALEAEELATARQAVGGIKLGNYLGRREPIPAGFFAEYPELGFAEDSEQATTFRQAARTGEPLSLAAFHAPTALNPEDITQNAPLSFEPENALWEYPPPPTYQYIIASFYREQVKSYYCGPATMESFADADGNNRNQYYWADILGTETHQLTTIWNLVPAINNHTNWSASYRGGPYAVVSVSGSSKNVNWFVAQHEIRIGVYQAPILEHVMLRRTYFQYLRFDYDGHYQTGRGYNHLNGTIAIFEPFDEQDWVTNGYATGKPQSVSFQNMWDATRLHPQQNFGR